MTELDDKILALRYDPKFWVEGSVFEALRDGVAWVNRGSPRDECFMALDTSLVYSYGNDNKTRKSSHTYEAVEMHPIVRDILDCLNSEGTSYNVCVLNYYKDEQKHLNWHADDSPEQDLDHPIAVVSFGATRQLFTKPKGFKGAVPDEYKFDMCNGSLLVMPGGYQDTHLHKIAKSDRPVEGRISLTFRKLER